MEPTQTTQQRGPIIPAWIRDLIKSEPSKWLPLILSLTAIGISCLSWWESHRGRIINEEVNRPILTLNSLETTFRRGRDYLEVTLKYNLKNVGKVEAVVTNASIQQGFESEMVADIIPRDLTCKLSPAPTDDGSTYLKVLPGFEDYNYQTLAVNKECGKLYELEFKDASIVVTYSDQVSGRLYLQEFKADIKLDLHGYTETPIREDE
jgi:hypothetical protein